MSSLSPLPPNNIHGTLGPRCATCSGLGVIGTLITDSVGTCTRCMGTGVEPMTPIELRKLAADIARLEVTATVVPAASANDTDHDYSSPANVTTTLPDPTLPSVSYGPCTSIPPENT